jgi:hypothetical protein
MKKPLVLLAVLSLLAMAFASPAVAARPDRVSHQKLTRITKVGRTSLHGGRVSAPEKGEAEVPGDEVRPDSQEEEEEADQQVPNSQSAAHVPSSHVPRPGGLPVVDATGGVGFNGLNHFDNRFAGAGRYEDTQFSLEPPDQALCVGNGMLVESVNTVLRARRVNGSSLTGVIPINQFFGLKPEVVRTDPAVFGDFTSDPKCLFDRETQRWFITILQLDVEPDTGDFTGPSSVLIAVSNTSDPAGAYTIFKIDTTNDGTHGTPDHEGCPCLGDQPLIGADATGFFVSTNEFPIFEDGFNGGIVYAMSKRALASGTLPKVVMFDNLTQAEGPGYSIQPTTTPFGASYATEKGGTEYFLSALDFDATLDNRITTWAATNTSSLDTATPAVDLHRVTIGSEVYGQPPDAVQKRGPTPLADALGIKGIAEQISGIRPLNEHLNLLAGNDDRMNQTVYVNGTVWGAVNTVVKTRNGPTRIGIAYFIVSPHWNGNALQADMTNQGYVSVNGASVMYPAVAANANGEGVIGYTLVGPTIYPSAAYSRVSATSDAGSVNIAARGVGPADGFTGYRSFGGSGTERWGDYSAAVSDEAGNIWFATEYIDQRCGLNEFLQDTTCGGTRSLLANWATFIASVNP